MCLWKIFSFGLTDLINYLLYLPLFLPVVCTASLLKGTNLIAASFLLENRILFLKYSKFFTPWDCVLRWDGRLLNDSIGPLESLLRISVFIFRFSSSI